MDITRRLAVAPYSRLNLGAWTQALTQATPTFPGSFQVNSWCAKQPQGSFLRALLEAAWSLCESGYLWHLKAALIPDLSFAAFSGLSLPRTPRAWAGRRSPGREKVPVPTPLRRQLGTRGFSWSGRCNGRERASRAGLTRGRGPPAAGAGAGAAGGCGRRRGAAGHRSGSALWAGAALAGGLRCAPPRVSKDGQWVGRRPHPRRSLARVRFSPAAGEVSRSRAAPEGPAGGASGPHGRPGRPRARAQRSADNGRAGPVGRAGACVPGVGRSSTPAFPAWTRPRVAANGDARRPGVEPSRGAPGRGALPAGTRPGPRLARAGEPSSGPSGSSAVSQRRDAGIPFLRVSLHLGGISVCFETEREALGWGRAAAG